MKLLQINVSANLGSTGRIAEGIGHTAMGNSWESYIAYGRRANKSESRLIRIGNSFDIKVHGLLTRVFDNHSLSFSSLNATKEFIKEIDKIKPDIIHLHNLHGYYLNIEVLFNYLATKDTPIVWTLHDCWSFTGHCSHFESVGCYKWKTHCRKCPLTRSYPASLLFDRSKDNFDDKKRLFNSVKNLTIIPVSNWLHNHLNESFLSEHTIKTIYNGVDLDIFRPDERLTNIKQKYNLNNKFVLLGVSSIWNKSKGLNDFIELSNIIDSNTVIILVGLQKEQIGNLPDNIVGIERTESQKELAELYAMSDLFVNPTYGDTFPTTNLEALACGTPVVTYKTGGSPEAITCETGFIVEKGNLKGVLKAKDVVRQKGKNHYTPLCRQRAEEYFNKDDRYQEYLELYEKILNKET